MQKEIETIIESIVMKMKMLFSGAPNQAARFATTSRTMSNAPSRGILKIIDTSMAFAIRKESEQQNTRRKL